MKKLGLIAAAAAVLALAGCNNGAQEVVNVTTVETLNYYDVSGSYVEKLSYTKTDGTKVTEETTYTASNKSYATVNWTDDEALDTNRKTYTVSVWGLSFTEKEEDGTTEKEEDGTTEKGEKKFKDVTYNDGSQTYNITKVGDEFFLGSFSSSKFAGNDELGITKIEELDLEDDEIELSYTYSVKEPKYTDGVRTYTVSFTLTKL